MLLLTVIAEAAAQAWFVDKLLKPNSAAQFGELKGSGVDLVGIKHIRSSAR